MCLVKREIDEGVRRTNILKWFNKSGGRIAHRMKRSIIYVIGIGFWIAFTAFCAQTNPFHILTSNRALVQVVYLSAYSIAFFVLAARMVSRHPVGRYELCIGSLCAIALAILTDAVGVWTGFSLGLECTTMILLAISSACGYCQWARLLGAFEGRGPQLILVLGSIIPIGSMLLEGSGVLGSLFAPTMCAMAGPLGYALLVVNTVMICRGCAKNSIPTQSGGSSRAMRNAVSALAPSIVCAMALVMISPFVKAIYEVWLGTVPVGELIGPSAHLAALVIISFIWFVLRKRVTLLQIYCVTLPIMGALILLSAFVAPQFMWPAIFVGDASFFLVSLLMVTTSIDIARCFRCEIGFMYGLIAGCVYLSEVVRQLLDYCVRAGFLEDKYYLLILLLLYLLTVPAFFAIMATVRNDRKKERRSGASQAEEESKVSLEEVCQMIAAEQKLTPRQAELLVFFAKGRDVAYIANALVLSPNTVRSYRKALYAALDTHSRQEVIDLVEARLAAEAETPRSSRP